MSTAVSASPWFGKLPPNVWGSTISSFEAVSEPAAPVESWSPPTTRLPEGEVFNGHNAKSTRGKTVAIVLLSIVLAAAVAAVAFMLVKLADLSSRLDEQQQQIDEQRGLIDQKESFGAAMQELTDTTAAFDGVLMTTIVPLEGYDTIASEAWAHRSNPTALDADIAAAQTATKSLKDLLVAKDAQATTNSTGTTYEAVIDQLGGGFVSSVVDDADTVCKSDVLACVMSDDPYTVHFDSADMAQPPMNEWLQTGVAYHEFAHVLQITNPEPTASALEAFGGDEEAMADCFALTYLDGWSLDHEIWVNRFEGWDISIGYGYTCNAEQAQVVREWYGKLGFHPRPIAQ